MDMASRQQNAKAAGEQLPANPKDAKNYFLREVVKREEYWEKLSDVVRKRLEGLLRLDPPVDTTITHRVKSKASLQGKIEKLQKLKKCLTLEAIHDMQWDIVGVRICLYFPRQLEQVKSFIGSNFEVIRQPSRINALNQAVAVNPVVRSIPAEFTSAKHFGERDYRMKDPESRPYKERMGYYEADHFWIKLRKVDSEKLPRYNNDVVEIQVRTVLMHAWAEVRHDLDYKHMMGLPSEDELRILDAIKGTIASCEIMQDVLFIAREQRIKADATEFGLDAGKSWSAVIEALKPGHRILLQQFGTKQPERYANVISFLEILKIYTPGELKRRLDDLDTSWKIKAASRSVCLAFSKPYSQYHTEKEYLSQPQEPSLFDFLAVYLLSTNSANMDFRNSYSVKTKEIKSRTGPPPPRMINESGKLVEQLEAKPHPLFGVTRKEHPESRAPRFYGILCTILCSLKSYLGVESDHSEAIVSKALSTIWHVHEWVATYFQDPNTHTEVEKIVENLLKTLQHWQLPPLSELLEWTFSVASYFRWIDINTEYDVGRRPPDHLIHTTNWARARHQDVCISPEEWNSEAWIQGEQAAADILGIAPAKLKNATLFRAVFQNHCNEEYVKHCLAHDEIDIHWQFGCGKSILGAAAMFGSPDICKMMLHHPKIDAKKLPAPDGLSLLHIAVIHENKAMVEELMSNRSLRQDTLWNRAKRDVYWSGHVTLESLTSKRQEVGAWCVPKGGWGKSSYKKVHSRTPQSVSRSSPSKGRQIDITRPGSESKEDGWTVQQIAGLLLGRSGNENNKNLQDIYKLLPP